MSKEKKETPTKLKVTEADFNFLKKVNGLKDEILVKKVKVQEKDKKEEKEVTSVIVVDDALSYMVHSTRLTPIFKNEKFGLKNIKGFLKAVTTYGEMEEHNDSITFTLGKKKITYKQLDFETIQDANLPVIDTKGYISIPLDKEEIKSLQEGIKNELSDYASLSITTGNKLIFKIGEMSFENIYEQEVKDVTRKETTEVKFLSKLKYMKRLFENIDEDSKTTLYLKPGGNPLIFVEKGKDTTTKTIIAQVIDTEDEEKIDQVIEEDN